MNKFSFARFSYRRLRHTYGFGVHSPFAFRLVKDVVRPGRVYAWYGYEDIDAAVNSRRAGIRMERQAKMFLRLLGFLNPGSLFLPLGSDPLYHVAASACAGLRRIERKPKHALDCRMIASHEDFLPLHRLKEHISRPGCSIVLLDYPREWLSPLFDALPEGLLLYSRRHAILIHRPGMMKLAYSVIL